MRGKSNEMSEYNYRYICISFDYYEYYGIFFIVNIVYVE